MFVTIEVFIYLQHVTLLLHVYRGSDDNTMHVIDLVNRVVSSDIADKIDWHH